MSLNSLETPRKFAASGLTTMSGLDDDFAFDEQGSDPVQAEEEEEEEVQTEQKPKHRGSIYDALDDEEEEEEEDEDEEDRRGKKRAKVKSLCSLFPDCLKHSRSIGISVLQ